MITWRDWVLFVIGIFMLLFILSGIAGCVYRYAITDFDCWFATDPVTCQKVKEAK